MEVVQTMTVPYTDYKTLTDIATAADQFCRTGLPEHLDELRDACFGTKAFAQD